MKMLVLLAKEHQADLLTKSLTTEGFRVTKISSTGGFLRKRVETLLIGIQAAQLDAALETVQRVADESNEPVTYFVLNVERFERV